VVSKEGVGVRSPVIGSIAWRFSRLASKIACCFGLLAIARLAAAQPTNARIVLTYDPSSEEQREALAAVRVHVGGSPVELVVESVEPGRDLAGRLAAAGTLATSHAALGTFSIEQAPDRSILVFFTEPGGSATLVRRLPASEAGTRVAIEQSAIVVSSLVEALLEGGRLGIVPERDQATDASVAEAPSPEPAPPAKAAPADPAEVFLFLGYVGTHPSGGLFWQSGAAAGVRWLVAPTTYVGARYTLIPAAEVDAGSTRVSIARRPVELLIGYASGTEVLMNFELSAIIEQTSRETLATDAAFEPTPPKSHWTFGLGPRAGAIVSPSTALRLAIRTGADFLLSQPSYETDERTVVAPGRIRPRLDVELGVGVW
jgi:hypothetical protein